MTPTAMFLLFVSGTVIGGGLTAAGIWAWLIYSWSRNN